MMSRGGARLKSLFFLLVGAAYCLFGAAAPIVDAAIDCKKTPDTCIDKEDIYSVNNSSAWYDPRLQKVTACNSDADPSTENDTNLPVAKQISFPADASVNDKIAQTLVLGIDVGSTSPDAVKELVRKYSIGGLYFTGTTNASDKGFNKSFFDGLNKIAKTPLMISSDEEGATSSNASLTPIHRFDYGSTNFPVAADLGSKSKNEIEKVGEDAGRVMSGFGITVDLAPVLDVDNGRGAAEQSVISKYGRAYSADPNTIATAAGAFAAGLQTSGVAPVFKHFPGLGSAWNGPGQGNNTDSYKVTGPSLAELRKKDLIPYQKLADTDNAAIMLSNEYIPDWDGGKVPVSQSPDAVKYLRDTLSFDGVIMTDSLSGPAGYENGGSVAQAVVRAEQAGANMILFDYRNVDMDNIIAAVKRSSVVATGSTKLDDSINKIIKFKNQPGSGKQTTGSTQAGCCSVSDTSGFSSIEGSADAKKNKPIIWAYFTSKGLTPEQTAGIMGNMQGESGFQPQRLQNTASGVVTPADKFSGDGGWGLVQWTPGTKMIDKVKAAKKDPNLLGVQLDFLWGQLYGKGKDLGANLGESEAGRQIKKTKTVKEASYAFGNYFERFGGHEDPNNSRYDERETFAQAVYEKFAKGATVSANAEPANDDTSSAGDCASTAVSISGDAGQLAAQILKLWGTSKDDVFNGESSAKRDLQATVDGKTLTHCRGTSYSYDPVGLNADLLKALLKLTQKYKIYIGNFMSGHSCDQYAHPHGWAVDIMTYTTLDETQKSNLSGNNPSLDKKFYAYFASIAPKDSLLLQADCFGRGNSVAAADKKNTSTGDGCNHQHFNVKQSKL